MRIRNTMNLTKKLIDYNAKLTEAQKHRLRQTPFKWVVDMTERITINAHLLEEMLSRWDPISYGFRVSCKTVAFTPVDVCFALGLQIVGTTVPLDDYNDCHVKSLFNGEEITVESIENKLSVLNNEENIEDFCRVYILFAFFALYFPRKSKNVNNVPFKLLDDLNMLETYNWGGAVHQFLVDSITRAAGEYRKGGAIEITVSGCSAVLQIWVLEHLPSCSVSTKSFPRIIKWTKLTERSVKMENIFLNAKLVEDLVPTEEDKQFEVVVEAIRVTAVRPRNDMNIDFDVEAVLTQQRRLLGENKKFRERISRLQAEIKLLKDDKGGKEESGLGKKEADTGGKEESVSGIKDDKGGKEESGSRKKEEDKGGKEDSGSGKKEEDKGGEEVSEDLYADVPAKDYVLNCLTADEIIDVEVCKSVLEEHKCGGKVHESKNLLNRCCSTSSADYEKILPLNRPVSKDNTELSKGVLEDELKDANESKKARMCSGRVCLSETEVEGKNYAIRNKVSLSSHEFGEFISSNVSNEIDGFGDEAGIKSPFCDRNGEKGMSVSPFTLDMAIDLQNRIKNLEIVIAKLKEARFGHKVHIV